MTPERVVEYRQEEDVERTRSTASRGAVIKSESRRPRTREVHQKLATVKLQKVEEEKKKRQPVVNTD